MTRLRSAAPAHAQAAATRARIAMTRSDLVTFVTRRLIDFRRRAFRRRLRQVYVRDREDAEGLVAVMNLQLPRQKPLATLSIIAEIDFARIGLIVRRHFHRDQLSSRSVKVKPRLHPAADSMQNVKQS